MGQNLCKNLCQRTLNFEFQKFVLDLNFGLRRKENRVVKEGFATAVESPPPLPTLLDLPPNLVDEILILLPIRDAVLTAALSRQWRHRWKSIPYLHFLDEFLPAAAISTILSLHSAPIHRFSLVTGHTHTDHMVDTWLISLSHRGGAHWLYLVFLPFPPRYSLHPSAFSFHKTLTHLYLISCSIDLPSATDFPSLLSLFLMEVDFRDNVDNPGQQLSLLLLSRCPALEHLRLF